MNDRPTIEWPAADAVDIWTLDLDTDPAELAGFESTLSSDEIARADRYRFDVDRRRFVACRGQVRSILAGYLGLGAAEVRFSYGEFGKPSVGGGLSFNVSHSHETALIAAAAGRSVGVDLEMIRVDRRRHPNPLLGKAREFRSDVMNVARRFFSETEYSALSALRPEEQTQGFFLCWTRKEAFIKARGEGLFRSLMSFDVSLAPGEPAALLAVRNDMDGTARWDLSDVRVPDPYVAAVAASGLDWRVVYKE